MTRWSVAAEGWRGRWSATTTRWAIWPLRGDVETIVGKALEKEKDRRYQSASAISADIRRYLSDVPIAARPPSATYQLRKFAKRNKAMVTGVAAVFVVLAAGVIASTTFAVGQARARAEADQQKTRAKNEAEKARVEAAKAAQSLVDLYTAWDGAEPGKGYDAKAAQWRAKLPAPDTAPADKQSADTSAGG